MINHRLFIYVGEIPFGLLDGFLRDVYARLSHPDFYPATLGEDLRDILVHQNDTLLLQAAWMREMQETAEELEIPKELITEQAEQVLQWFIDLQESIDRPRLFDFVIKSETMVILAYETNSTTSPYVPKSNHDSRVRKFRFAISEKSI